MEEKITDDEVLQIMIDGGEKLCEHAITQWISYKYASDPRNPTPSDESMRREYIWRWNTIKKRIRPLAHQLKGQQNEDQVS